MGILNICHILLLIILAVMKFSADYLDYVSKHVYILTLKIIHYMEFEQETGERSHVHMCNHEVINMHVFFTLSIWKCYYYCGKIYCRI